MAWTTRRDSANRDLIVSNWWGRFRRRGSGRTEPLDDTDEFVRMIATLRVPSGEIPWSKMDIFEPVFPDISNRFGHHWPATVEVSDEMHYLA